MNIGAHVGVFLLQELLVFTAFYVIIFFSRLMLEINANVYLLRCCVLLATTFMPNLRGQLMANVRQCLTRWPE